MKRKFNKVQKIGMAIAFACVAAGAAHAEVDAAITGLITNVQTTALAIVAAVLVAGAAILLGKLGLQALPFAYARVSRFFGGK